MYKIVATKAGAETETTEYRSMHYTMLTMADLVQRGYIVTIFEER